MASDLDGAGAKGDENWMPFIVLIQSKGNMRRDEILAAPLLLLNSIHKELVTIVTNDYAGTMSAGMAGMCGGTPQPKKDSRMGEMPQFNTRDEYFDFINKHS